MKATELMIGDWAIYADEEIVKIHSIFGDEYADFYYTFEETEYGPDIRLVKAKIKDFEPIPLTAEILEKNGFKDKDADLLYTFYDGWNFEIHNKTTMVSCGSIWYVHELQRALKCCGLWDLANNFKII